jgi:uncharacterized damage-inducible protein DinB
MSSALIEMFRYNLWANLGLLEACDGLADSVLDATTPGTYGSARDTLLHLCASEERYVLRLTGKEQKEPLSEDNPFPGHAELRKRAKASGEGLITIATRFRSRIIKGVYRGQRMAIPAVIFMVQAINHATEHRAHVMTILTQQGVRPPDLDAWHYAGVR